VTLAGAALGLAALGFGFCGCDPAFESSENDKRASINMMVKLVLGDMISLSLLIADCLLLSKHYYV
jgi:hypothetical protein